MNVTVYTNKNCVQCDATKRWLEQNKINFETALISDSPEVDALIKEKNFQAAPVVVAGEMSWSGFRLEKLKTIKNMIFSEDHK
jgi:glutaredoxin-like protein NrdH